MITPTGPEPIIYQALSSVLPPTSSVHVVDRIGCTPGGWGDRLYCVVAQARTAVPGTQAWAGVGWVQDASGRGLLVEHHAADEVGLRRLIRTSLDALGRNRNLSFPSTGVEVAGVHCVDEPVCALVVAVFESAAWTTASRPAYAAACA